MLQSDRFWTQPGMTVWDGHSYLYILSRLVNIKFVTLQQRKALFAWSRENGLESGMEILLVIYMQTIRVFVIIMVFNSE